MSGAGTDLHVARSRPTRWLLLAAAVTAGVVAFAPLVWMLAGSVRPGEEILREAVPIGWHTLVPIRFTLDNLVALFSGPFLRAIVNSLLVATISVVFGLVINAMAGFAFATMRFRGRDALFAVVVFSFLIPFEVLAVPLSQAVRELGLTNSYLALVLPGIGNGLAVFMLRQFFLAVPGELREAAAVDGAGWWRVFTRIYLPLSIPALVSAGLLLFLFQWQAYLWPLLITTDRAMDVGPVALARFFDQYDVDYGQLFAGSAVLSLIPAMLLLRFQRTFTTSVARSGVKG
ncbi:carbohydrate ABC transporter permease [Nitriliruptoraceae bacterium ZYF776]|nr:carbohydrate ABC transporter permease [Profundirhabdus halotolerans]